MSSGSDDYEEEDEGSEYEGSSEEEDEEINSDEANIHYARCQGFGLNFVFVAAQHAGHGVCAGWRRLR